MKEIITPSFVKLAKSKYPKEETEPYNPWAVCTDSAGRDDKDKYERCVQHLKDQNKKEHKKKSAGIEETKPVGEGELYTPHNEDSWIDESKGHRFQRRSPNSVRLNPEEQWQSFLDKFRALEKEPVLAEKKKD